MLTILLPSLPLQRTVDPMWAEEFQTAQAHGYHVALFDVEQPRLYGPLPAQPVLYRGWMLSEPEYRWLEAQCPMLVSYEQYAASHEATGWYEVIRDYTFPSEFMPVQQWLQSWDAGDFARAQFVKSPVKSFGAASHVAAAFDAHALVTKQALAPAELLFVRDFVELLPDYEQRFFVVNGAVFGPTQEPFPEDLLPAVQALQQRRFYTIDVAYTDEGWPIIVEVGDGQVSDVKEWTVAELYERVINMLAAGL